MPSSISASRPGTSSGFRSWVLIGISASSILLLGMLQILGQRSARPPNVVPTRPITLNQPQPTVGQFDLLNDIFNATLGFQKIFVVNLPSRSDRRDAMSLAAAYSGFQVEYVDGVFVTDDDLTQMQKIMPPLPPPGEPLSAAPLGSWRAHTNAIRKIVEQNLTSALILEDDIDWDLRLKTQMRDFAIASRMLVQPLLGTQDQFLDLTMPMPKKDQKHQDFTWQSGLTTEPTTSPYGDINRWDLFWLGHCGGILPKQNDNNSPLGRVVMSNDSTVPEPQHVDMGLGSKELLEEYPPHTRLVHRARHNMCITGYALSQPGARRFLYELGVHKQGGAADVVFGAICDGVKERGLATCLTVQPSLFQHHRPVGWKSSFSDISGWIEEYNDVAFTNTVRWSTRLNFPKLANGETDFVDSFPDGG